jgi:peptidoglycan/LPS O-acetylase OafA/YrhL
LAVLETHAWGWHNDYGPATLATNLGKILTAGDFGVNVFFTLTGFLLATPFLKALLGGHAISLGRYFRNRALRILPLYYVVLVVFLLAGGGGTLAQWVTFGTFSENLFAWSFLTVDPPMWSLVLEVQFYVLLPIGAMLIGLAPRHRRALVVAVSIALLGALSAWLSWTPRFPSGTVPYARSLLVNFHFFAAGILLAVAGFQMDVRRWATRPWGSSDLWFVVAAGLFLVGALDPTLLPVTAIATGLTVGAAALPLRPGVVTRCLDWPKLGALGLASYSLYLWHYPIVKWLAGRIESFPVLLVVSAVSCCLIAVVSYRLIEAPFLRLRRRWER